MLKKKTNHGDVYIFCLADCKTKIITELEWVEALLGTDIIRNIKFFQLL